MKIVFISNYFNHHQKPLSDALFGMIGEGYSFISTSTMSEERKKRAEAESRCVELQDQIVAMQEKCNQKVTRVKTEYADGFSFLKTEVADLKAEKADYLKRIDKKNRILTFLSVITVLLAIATTILLIYK